jgi:hypothetical protein
MLSINPKSVVDTIRELVLALKKRRNPARAQAQRLLDAFAAHGVAGVQIPRLLPEALALPNADFADPDELKTKLTPRLLDWTAGTFALRRGWLDGVDSERHHRVQGYKLPSIYRDWLQQCQELFPDVDRIIHVFVTSKEPLGPQSTGSLCVAYGERFDTLDTQELSRYWLLSDHWRLDHSPCTVNLMALCAIAGELGIMVIGHVVRQDALTRLDDGQLFVPQVLALDIHRWFPSDLIDPPPGQDSEWRRILWSDARAMLESGNPLNTSATKGIVE